MSDPPWQAGRVQTNERPAMNEQQLELTFAADAPGAAVIGSRVSQDRAAWWFDRIHSRLRRALRPAPPARHQQEPFDLGDGRSERWGLDAPRWGAGARAESQALEHAA